MAEKLDPKETVDLRQVVLSEIIQGEALINLEELLEEVKRVAAKMPKAEG